MLEIGPADAIVIECLFSMVKAPSSIPIKKEEEEKGKRRGMRERGRRERGLCFFCSFEVFPVLLVESLAFNG